MAKNDFKGTLQEGLNLLDQYEKKLVEINAVVEKVVNNIAQSNKNGFDVKTPKQVNQKLQERAEYTRQLTAYTKERVSVEKALIRQTNKNILAEQKVTDALIKQRFETQQRNKEARASAILSSKLSTEYQKLVVRMNQAGASVQNLTAKRAQGKRLSNEEQRELKQSQLEFKKYQSAVLKADASIGRFQRNVGNYQSALGKAGLALRNFAGVFGVFSAGIIAREIFNTVKELDGLDKALKQVTETTENYTRAQSFLSALAEEAGVQIQGLQGSYTKFLASAKTTNLTLEQTEDIFRQTAKAGAVLGLSTDDINGSFRALEQILSKGKVQAEEIRGQLGERLPGAFQILAKSMGLTTQELSKQLELGNVISEEVLPNFARELAKTYSLDAIDRVETLTSAQNRLSNAWTDFIRSLDGSDGVLTRVFTKTINFLTDIVNLIAEVNKGSEGLSDDLFKNAKQREIDFFNESKSITNQRIELIKIELQNKKLSVEERKKLEKEISDFEKTNASEAIEIAKIRKSNLEEELTDQKIRRFELERMIDLTSEWHKTNKITRQEHDAAKKELDKLNISMSSTQGALAGVNEVLGTNSKKLKENTDETKTNNKERKKTMQAIKGSIGFLEKEISRLKSEQKSLATNSKEWENYNKQIDVAKKNLEDLKVAFEGLDLSGLGTGDAEEAFKRINEILTSPKTLDGFDYEAAEDDLDNFAKKLQDAKDKEVEIYRQAAEAKQQLESHLGESFLSITNSVFDAKIMRYDEDIQRNNDYYAALLDNQSLTEEQRSAIEAERDRKNAELEKKKRETGRKAAMFNKVSAVAEIAIDTVKQVAKIKAQAALLLANPLTAPLASIALALIPTTIATGAAAAAAALAVPIPQYKHGTKDAPEGFAIVGDGGKHEIVKKKDGSMSLTPNKSTLTYLDKGDEVIPDAKKYLDGIGNDDLTKDLYRHSALASFASQGVMIGDYLKKVDNGLEKQTRELVKAYKKAQPRINLHNHNNIDLEFLMRKQNTL